MADLCGTVNSGLAGYFETVAAKLHKWVDPLSDQQFWRNPFAYGNDIGHLVLHLTGNLNHYIGAHIAGTGYVRHRDVEFTQRECPKKEDVLREFDRAISMVTVTIRKQSAEDWSAEYSVEPSIANDRFEIVLDCAAHADHHVGQIINLSRELTHQAERTRVKGM
jgi:uncharacterized damage-inducible protein DinB